MRIALVCPSFLPQIGGAECVAHHLAVEWFRQGHEVQVMNYFTNEATHAEGRYTVRRYSLLRGSSRFGYHRFPFQWYAVRSLQKLLKTFQPDFISAHYGYPTGVWLSQIRPLPRFLVTCHGIELYEADWAYRHIYKIDRVLAEALNASAGAIAISRQARQLMEGFGVKPSKIVDIPNGVDLERFSSPVKTDFRARMGLPSESRVVLSVGRENAAKAYDVGIRAFGRARADAGDLHYVILGAGTHVWQPLIDELDLNGRVVLSPGLYGDELVAAYQQADIFFLPSRIELFPLVLVEAMAAGLPAVVTNISGGQDVIETGHNGIIVERDREEEMAQALVRLALDASLRRQMGSVNLVKSGDYSWDRISRLYLDHA